MRREKKKTMEDSEEGTHQRERMRVKKEENEDRVLKYDEK